MRSEALYVVCPHTIVGPAPTPAQESIGLRPNEPCSLRSEVVNLAAQMEFRCGRGHSFVATPDDVKRGQIVERGHGCPFCGADSLLPYRRGHYACRSCKKGWKS